MLRIMLLSLVANTLAVPSGFAQIAHDPMNLVGVLDVSGRYDGEPSPVLGVPVDWFAAAWGEEASPKEFTVARDWPLRGSDIDLTEQRIPLSDFLLIETDYEQPHISVFAKQGQWLEVRVKDAPVWIRAESTDKFVPYTTLVSDSLPYLTTSSITFAETPDGPLNEFDFEPSMQGAETKSEFWTPTISVLEVRPNLSETSAGTNSTRRGWIKIQVTDVPHCSALSTKTETTIFEGWIPSHQPDGSVSVWFHSRGC
ncbi:hypothetical protein [Denitrobaculum tricleocarpae]|uniref:SH3 domain-containing protein n=1 Tax=Denitrobaculum tricleocarpae TaxID=2591009 RepID=A0A545TTI6_9PROT|nr:hypothetical protein [Denitrobaculum tricleocarpae]TQV80530.1 hypothetical protein FKG95_10150 [Denitrobaculum tricleocarpae]